MAEHRQSSNCTVSFFALLRLLTPPIQASSLLVSQGGSTVALQPGDLASFPPGEAMCQHVSAVNTETT